MSAVTCLILSINQCAHDVTSELQCTDTSYPLGGFKGLFIQSSPMEWSELLKPEISCLHLEKWSHFLIKLRWAIFPQSPYGKTAVVKHVGRIIKLPLYLYYNSLLQFWQTPDTYDGITEASLLISMPMGTVTVIKRRCSRDNYAKDVNRQAIDWGEGEGLWVRLGKA